MNLADVMDQIAAQLDTIVGLRVVAYPDGAANPPCAIMAMPSQYTFDETYGRGSDQMTVPVVVLVPGEVPRAARNALAAYCQGAGAKSVKAVLEADGAGYTAFDSARVTGIEFDAYQIGAVTYPAAIFSIDIIGKGAQ